MEETKSFRLQHGRKTSWFDSHKKFLDQHHLFRRDRKERYQEILRKNQSQSDIDQCEAYYQTVGGETKIIIYGLGFEAQSYYGPNLRITSGTMLHHLIFSISTNGRFGGVNDVIDS